MDETQCISRGTNWEVSLKEPDQFIWLVITRGIPERRDLPRKALWNKSERKLPCEVEWRFIQYVTNNTFRFGLKLWIAVDAAKHHLITGFPYLGKDVSRNLCVTCQDSWWWNWCNCFSKVVIMLHMKKFLQVLILPSVWQKKNAAFLRREQNWRETRLAAKWKQ